MVDLNPLERRNMEVQKPDLESKRIPIRMKSINRFNNETSYQAKCPYCPVHIHFTFEFETQNMCEHYRANDRITALFTRRL